ncbi:MAG: hypothetical protein NC489_39125 [Ruminococcus flavefaciens]|nr:hypothetical protein [Ruminococcus flavefaciens]
MYTPRSWDDVSGRNKNQLDFDKIALSGRERKLLKKIAKNHVLLSEKNTAVFGRLQHFRFAHSFQDTNSEHTNKIAISDRGRDYLAFINAKASKSRAEWIRYIITTAIAVLALVLAGISLAAQLGLIQLPAA